MNEITVKGRHLYTAGYNLKEAKMKIEGIFYNGANGLVLIENVTGYSIDFTDMVLRNDLCGHRVKIEVEVEVESKDTP